MHKVSANLGSGEDKTISMIRILVSYVAKEQPYRCSKIEFDS